MLDHVQLLSTNSGPRDATGFPKKWSQSAYWAFCSHQKGVSYNNPPFFFMEGVLILGTGNNLSNTSMLDEALSLFSSTCRASHLLCQGTWGCGAVMEEMNLLCWAGTCCQCPLSLNSVTSSRGSEDRESPGSCVLSSCQACPTESRV